MDLITPLYFKTIPEINAGPMSFLVVVETGCYFCGVLVLVQMRQLSMKPFFISVFLVKESIFFWEWHDIGYGITGTGYASVKKCAKMHHFHIKICNIFLGKRRVNDASLARPGPIRRLDRHLNCPPHFLGLATALMFTSIKHYMWFMYIVNLNIF